VNRWTPQRLIPVWPHGCPASRYSLPPAHPAPPFTEHPQARHPSVVMPVLETP